MARMSSSQVRGSFSTPSCIMCTVINNESRTIKFDPTGNAGTGKSFLLNRIIASLRKTYGADFTSCVAVTAATGIAATHISGESSSD